MRSNFRNYFPSTEGYRTDRPILSLEEEQLDTAEAVQTQGEVAADLDEADRITEVSEVLDNTADIAENIDTATPAEAALVESVGDAAVAGTEVPAEDVVPSMESYVGRKLSVEGIRETAYAIWKSIQATLKKIWEKIKYFWNKFFGVLPNLRRRIAAMKERVENVTGLKKENNKFEISSGVSSLCLDYKGVKNGAELKSALDVQLHASKLVFNELGADVAKFGESIADVISDTDAANAQGQAVKLLAVLNAEMAAGAKKIKKNAIAVKGWEGFHVSASEQLLGSVRIVCKFPKESVEGDKVLGKLDMYRRAGVTMAHSRENTASASVPASIDFATMDYSQMLEVLEVSERIVEAVEDFENNKARKDIEKARLRLDTACEKAAKSYDKVRHTDEAAERAGLPYFRGMLNFNTSFTRWVEDPSMRLASMSIAAVRASVSVVEKSIAQYK